MIDSAINENAKWDWARYLMALSFTATAVGALAVGVYYNQGWPVAGGTAAAVGARGMIYFISNVWKANTALRMLELSLSDKKTATDARNDLREIYRKYFGLDGG